MAKLKKTPSLKRTRSLVLPP